MKRSLDECLKAAVSAEGRPIMNDADRLLNILSDMGADRGESIALCDVLRACGGDFRADPAAISRTTHVRRDVVEKDLTILRGLRFEGKAPAAT